LIKTDADQAYRVNALGTRNVAMGAAETGAELVYISTDYVFDGTARQPYREYDPTNPQTVYGRSKLAGEQFVKQWTPRHYILRTSWVFGMNGNNFVKTMLKLGAERDFLNVVHDQIGSPTFTKDLASFMAVVSVTDYYGSYHVSNSGTCSRYEFAKAIFERSGNARIRLKPVTTSEFPRLAPRPAYSVMDHSAIRWNGFNDLRHWKAALNDFLTEYESQSE
jgi:dTDP-4-dehydrorhamnose reductase